MRRGPCEHPTQGLFIALFCEAFGPFVLGAQSPQRKQIDAQKMQSRGTNTTAAAIFRIALTLEMREAQHEAGVAIHCMGTGRRKRAKQPLNVAWLLQ